MRYPISPYTYPLRDYKGYLILTNRKLKGQPREGTTAAAVEPRRALEAGLSGPAPVAVLRAPWSPRVGFRV